MVNLVTLGMFGGAGIGGGQTVQTVVQAGIGGGYTAMKPSVQFVKIEEEDPEINIVVTDIIDMSTIW